MFTKKIIPFLLIFFFTYVGNAQITLKVIDSVSFKNKNYQQYKGTDIHGNSFFLQQESLIKTDGENKWEYADLQLGIPTSVSTINPLQVLVFYELTNTFVLLDRFLSEVKRVNLNNITPIRIAKWVQNTKNKEVWLYNSLNNQLEFYNYKTNTKITDNNPISNEPKDLASGFNSAYLLFEDKITGFNNYGSSICETTIDNIQKIELNNNLLLAISNTKFHFFDTNLKSLNTLKKPKNSTQGVFLGNEKLYIYSNSTLYTYQLITQ